MKILTVIGSEHIGKTTFIKDFFIRLLKTKAEVIFFECIGNCKQDFHAIILWKSRIIAFCSAGDIDNPDWSIINAGFAIAEKYNATILINALSIGSGLSIGGYENLLNQRYNNKEFERIIFTKKLSKISERIKFKKIMKFIKDSSPCSFLSFSSLNQKRRKHLALQKHSFSNYALLTIVLTIIANTVLTLLSRNNLNFIILSIIIIICLNITIIFSFFKPKKKTKYKAEILSEAFSFTENMINQTQTVAKELAEVHKSTVNALADI